ncbi:MAG: MobA/MobL family protein [Rhodoferax sp.]|nr:MobA/MobL family protein [Rhodoferax sp.]
MSPLFRVELTPIQRSKGHSAVSAVGYQRATRFTDVRTGRRHDFRHKTGVISSQLILPGGIVEDSEVFWNQVELHHRKSNAVTSREQKIALPKQLSSNGLHRLVHRMAIWLCKTYSVGVDLAIHAPRYFDNEDISKLPDQYWEMDAEGRKNNGNWHAHLILSACRVRVEEGQYVLEKKCIELDPIACERERLENPAHFIRTHWCNFVNEAPEAEGFSDRVDHRSYKVRGVQEIPRRPIGAKAAAFERRTGNVSARRKKDEERVAMERRRRRLRLLDKDAIETLKRLQVRLAENLRERELLDQEVHLERQRLQSESLVTAAHLESAADSSEHSSPSVESKLVELSEDLGKEVQVDANADLIVDPQNLDEDDDNDDVEFVRERG